LPANVRSWSVIVLALAAMLVLPSGALAQDPNACDVPGDEPDVLIGSLHELIRHGEIDDITAFSIGTYACNIGTCWLNWIPNTNEHPVIGLNVYRLKDGRFEQIGMSWLKHGFYALSNELCDTGCIETNGWHLGVNCADPYSASLNGAQERLAPRYEINPYTGDFPFPGTGQSQTGNAIFKRLQVHNVDLDPALNPDSQYFAEGFYVTADDHAAGNMDNNYSYRPLDAWETSGNYYLGLTGETTMGMPAVEAWVDNDPGAKSVYVQEPFADGPFVVGHKATMLPNGRWHYEYAVENLQSYRAARSFAVPVPPGVLIENVGFHDVDYHSGEPIDGTDWVVTLDTSQTPNLLTWQTIHTHAQNPYANAIYYGSTYNFRFDSDVQPTFGQASLGLFRPGMADSLTVPVYAPNPDAPISVAGVPDAPLTVDAEALGDLILSWGSSCMPTDTGYAIYEGTIGDFTSHVPIDCNYSATSMTMTPSSGNTYYLVVPHNGTNEGSYGVDSDGVERPPAIAACYPQSVGYCW
jgi:hypothetical protein